MGRGEGGERGERGRSVAGSVAGWKRRWGFNSGQLATWTDVPFLVRRLGPSLSSQSNGTHLT